MREKLHEADRLMNPSSVALLTNRPGELALPGISIGHNGKIVFGLTIFSIDRENLYIYETKIPRTQKSIVTRAAQSR